MTRENQILTVEIADGNGSTFSLREICERGDCHAEFVIKLVNYGILDPVEPAPEAGQWQFDVIALGRLQRALRLQRDLNLKLPGLALSLDLLDEVNTLRRDMARLEQRLKHLTGE